MYTYRRTAHGNRSCQGGAFFKFWILAAAWMGVLCGTVPGADFKISLSVQAGKAQQSSDSGRPGAKRPEIDVRAGESLLVHWSAVNSETPLPDVTLHVFMDRQSAPGRTPASRPSSDAAYESAVVLDFEPGAKSAGEFRMPAPEPGTYLLRAEAIGTGKKLGQQYFAEVEVRIP